MFYDELVAQKERLEAALILLSCDIRRTDKQIEKGQLRILQRINLIKQKISDIEKNCFGCKDKEESKMFKKEIKHEFLSQAKNGHSYRDILQFLKSNYHNPGINIEKFLDKLEYDEQTDKGYYKLMAEDKLVLTIKAKRFLENEANVSLKR